MLEESQIGPLDLSPLNIGTNSTLVGHSGIATDIVELGDILHTTSWKSVRKGSMWGLHVVVKHWVKDDMFSLVVLVLSPLQLIFCGTDS
jgi:hypothetical protein